VKILNLGSGIKTSAHPDVANVDWSVYLRLKRSPLLGRLAARLLTGERKRRLAALPDNMVSHDLSKGIPFEDASVDVVYHSHMLEHLDRWVAPQFMQEVHRVLRPGGIQRIVVPDLERLCRDYLEHLRACADDPALLPDHDRYVAEILEQSVRRDAYAMRGQSPPRRVLERILVGDARRRGETHQWMYDEANLGQLLRTCGFREIRRVSFEESSIPEWSGYGLDTDEAGNEYKPGSLYVEAVR
jgi:SAM-dependent methyltransferase